MFTRLAAAFALLPTLAFAQLLPPVVVTPSPNQPVVVQSAPPVVVLPPAPVELPQPYARPWHWRAPQAHLQALDPERAATPRTAARHWNAAAAYGGALLGLAIDAGISGGIVYALLSRPRNGWLDFGPELGAFAAGSVGLALLPVVMGGFASWLGGDDGAAMGWSIFGAFVGAAASAMLVAAVGPQSNHDAALAVGIVGALALAPAGAAAGFALGARQRDRQELAMSIAPSPEGLTIGMSGTF